MQPEIDRLRKITIGFTRTLTHDYYTQETVNYLKEVYRYEDIGKIPSFIRADTRFYAYIFQDEDVFNRNMGFLLDDIICFTDKEAMKYYLDFYYNVWAFVLDFLCNVVRFKDRRLYNEDTIEKLENCIKVLEERACAYAQPRPSI
jgi:hypothetical protein